MVREEICKDAIKLWGVDAQLDMVIEECSELIKAICKYKRSHHKEIDSLHVAEEHADVLIMLDQLSYIMSKHDPEHHNTYHEIKKCYTLDKVVRLTNRIDSEKRMK